MNINKKRVYVVVRTDIEISHQMVQANHASFEAGLNYNQKLEISPSLVVLKVKNKKELEKAYEFIKKENINLTKFIENRCDYGFTAFASEPVTMEQRKFFRKYQLWKI